MRRLAILLATVFATPTVSAQSQPLEVIWPTGENNPERAIVSSDLDDDNDDGVPDALEQPAPGPAADDEIVPVIVNVPRRSSLRVTSGGKVRIVTRAGLVQDTTSSPSVAGRETI